MSSAFAGEYIPKVGFTIVAADWLVESSRMARIHNRVSKGAAHAAMLLHWKKYLPRHFQQNNRSLYDHVERSPGYKASKRKTFGSITDLVKTGRTRDYMTTLMPMIRHSGSADSLLITTMYLRWPFPAGKVDSRSVTREQMNKELGRWVDEEESEIRDRYAEIYVQGLMRETKNRPRLKRHYQSHGVF